MFGPWIQSYHMCRSVQFLSLCGEETSTGKRTPTWSSVFRNVQDKGEKETKSSQCISRGSQVSAERSPAREEEWWRAWEREGLKGNKVIRESLGINNKT